MELRDVEQAAPWRALNPEEVRSLIRSRHRLRSGGETKRIELKRGLASAGHRKTEDWVKLLSTAVSMANGGGGYVVFGVSNGGKLFGISKSLLQLLDPARVQDQIRKYSPDARLVTQLTVADYYSKTYAALWVAPAENAIVFDRPGDYVDASGTQKQAFQPGIIYIRDPGGRRAASHADVERILHSLVERRLSRVLAKIEQVAHAPPDAELLAYHPEYPNRAYRLLSKGEGQPVRITSDDTEPAVLLREVFDTDLPYEAANDEVAAQVRFWKTRPDHRISKAVCFEWLLKRGDVEWDADSAELCLLSACHDHAYPMFWARELHSRSPEELLRVVNMLLAAPSYPEIQYVPYLIGGFFWDDRAELLEYVLDAGYLQAARTAERIQAYKTFRDFILLCRGPGQTIRLADEIHEKEDLLEDLQTAHRLFDRVVELRHQVARGEISGDEVPQLSATGHQLDMLCFCSQSEG